MGNFKVHTGQCRPSEHVIMIGPSTKRQLLCTVIHEICHAVAGISHGQRWRKRFLQAASQAEALSLRTLAEDIREQVSRYQSHADEIGGSRLVYQTIEEIVLESKTVPSFRDVVSYFSREYNLLADEFERDFKRGRAVYERAKRKRVEHELLTAHRRPARQRGLDVGHHFRSRGEQGRGVSGIAEAVPGGSGRGEVTGSGRVKKA
jgi:hypothetical protein